MDESTHESDDRARLHKCASSLHHSNPDNASLMHARTEPVVSSVNVPTIPLAVAQAMNPAPRPPSPNARAATQRAMRRENTNQLSTRDAEILMSLSPTPSNGNDRGGNRLRIDSFFSELQTEAPLIPSESPKSLAPPVRPPREMRRAPSTSEVRYSPRNSPTFTY